MKSRLILASIIFGIIIISNLNHVFAYDERITVSPGSIKKKSVTLESGDKVNFGLSVSGGQNDDIIFTIYGPGGTYHSNTVYSYLRSDFVATTTGKYDFVFDNKMSYISTKHIQFDWQITKPTLGITHSETGGFSASNGFLYVILFLGIVVAVTLPVILHNRNKRKKFNSSEINLEEVTQSKKSFWKKCYHIDTWIREDNTEICNNCGKELRKLATNEKQSDQKSESKLTEIQQKLDSFVVQSSTNNSETKETINDIDKNEKALTILKERLAKGELTLQDFQELKKEISS